MRGVVVLAVAHTSLEQHELAIEDYTRVIDLDPWNRDILYSRGIARMYVARYESAIEDEGRAAR